MVEKSIVKYSPKYKYQVLNLLSYHWNDLNPEERKKRFEWRYEHNPYTESPQCYVALDGEKVVGHRGFVVQKFKLIGKNYLFCTPADSVVHPDYRRQGIFSNLIKFSKKDLISNSNIDLILSLSANKASTEATLKAGYEPVGQRDNMYFVSFFDLFKIFLKSNQTTNLSTIENNLKIEIGNKLKSKEISRLMGGYEQGSKITNVRDEEFYRWRFKECPDKYIFGYCIKEDELVGYLSLRKKSDKFYVLMEYGYDKPLYFEYIFREIRKHFSIPVIQTHGFTRTKEEIKLLLNLGFRKNDDKIIKILKRTKGIKRTEDLPGALIKPISENITEDDFILNGKDVRDPENWSLFKSDVH